MNLKQSVIYLGVICFSLLLSACQTKKAPQKQQPASKLTTELAAAHKIEQGIHYLEIGNNEQAKAQFEQALNQAPEMAAAHYAMAYYYEHTGDMVSAEARYKKALAFDPKDGDTLNNYATFLCRQGRYVHAERTFMQSVDDPRFLGTAYAYQNAGLCLLSAKNIEKADAYFTTALAIDPQLSDSLLELAQIRYEQHLYEEAHKFYNRYLKVGETTPRSLWLGLNIANKQGREDVATTYKLQLRNAFPQSPEAKLLQEINP